VTDGPPSERFIDAAGHRTHILEQGIGHPLVLLHGSGPGVSARSNWADVIPEFARNFRVIAPDIAGFGYTQSPDRQAYNIKVWVAHYVGILDALGIEKASVVGNSFGGALALATALSNAHRVDKLILLGTPAGDFEMTEGLKSSWRYEPSKEAMRRVLSLFPYDKSVITDDMVHVRFEASARPGAQEAFRKLVAKPNDDGPTPVKGIPESSLAKVEHSTLVLHGREDRVIPLELGLRLLNAIPNAQLHVFGRCGHWVQVERKKEFIQLVTQFAARRA